MKKVIGFLCLCFLFLLFILAAHELKAGQKSEDAFPTPVNNQITDSATQTNVKVLGDAPAIAMGNVYQTTVEALSNAAYNATSDLQQSNVTAQVTTAQGVATLYGVDRASTPEAKQEISEEN